MAEKGDRDRGYIEWNPRKKTRAKLEQVQQVLDEYHDYLPMTVRQIFYVLVARQVIEKSKDTYWMLGYWLRKARRARMIPFEHIHDRDSTLPHSLIGNGGSDDLSWLIRYQVENFHLDGQLDQDRRLVLWCEAAGMLSQLERVAAPHGVHVVSGGGFDSLSDKWKFAQLVGCARAEFEVLHIGDLDDHGESIFDVLMEDVQAFVETGSVWFTRLAVTRQQVVELDLPTDPEHPDIVQAEAIPPDVLARLVDDAITDRLDLDLMAEVAGRSAAIRGQFEKALDGVGL